MVVVVVVVLYMSSPILEVVRNVLGTLRKVLALFSICLVRILLRTGSLECLRSVSLRRRAMGGSPGLHPCVHVHGTRNEIPAYSRIWILRVALKRDESNTPTLPALRCLLKDRRFQSFLTKKPFLLGLSCAR